MKTFITVLMLSLAMITSSIGLSVENPRNREPSVEGDDFNLALAKARIKTLGFVTAVPLIGISAAFLASNTPAMAASIPNLLGAALTLGVLIGLDLENDDEGELEKDRLLMKGLSVPLVAIAGMTLGVVADEGFCTVIASGLGSAFLWTLSINAIVDATIQSFGVVVIPRHQKDL